MATPMSLPVRERGSKQFASTLEAWRRRSLPVRERGSKRVAVYTAQDTGRRSPCGSVDRNADRPVKPSSPIVAPRAGAWIETSSPPRRRPAMRMSLPVRERGSKLDVGRLQPVQVGRSPCGSVDRNVNYEEDDQGRKGRSPCGSVDRNMVVTGKAGGGKSSLPVRERGSKLGQDPAAPLVTLSLPVRERGSKPVNFHGRSRISASLPVRERGSKLVDLGDGAARQLSLPVRERGSKLRPARRNPRIACRSPCGSVDRNIFKGNWRSGDPIVAPRAGAWIETSRALSNL